MGNEELNDYIPPDLEELLSRLELLEAKVDWLDSCIKDNAEATTLGFINTLARFEILEDGN